jgi:HEPN domain-containing protein
MDRSCDEWLKRAKSSLKISKTAKDKDVYYEDLCFEAQQCAEKALKGLLVYFNQEICKVHSFHVILEKIEKLINIPNNVKEVTELSDYAIQTRYPGDYRPIDKEEYERAVQIAKIVLEWVTGIVK